MFETLRIGVRRSTFIVINLLRSERGSDAEALLPAGKPVSAALPANQFPSLSGPHRPTSRPAVSAGSRQSCFNKSTRTFRGLLDHLPVNSSERDFHPATPASSRL